MKKPVQKKQKEEYIYTKVDMKVEKIIKNVAKHNKIFEKKFIHEEVQKAYLYARDAHE
jgi:Leu/Phe-tRNA-protein transferase